MPVRHEAWDAVNWQLFDKDAQAYEAWYESAKGRRADQSERALLQWLLRALPEASSALEVGSGTGHFTVILADKGLFAVGLDRAPAMIWMARHLHPCLPLLLGDAHQLPLRNGAVDVTVFITSLEFLERPEVALTEAVRVTRSGLILVTLNKWSEGALSRRWGEQARGGKLSMARDYALPELLTLVRMATSDRLERISWRSALFPIGPATLVMPVPVGDVIGVAATLQPPAR